MSKNNSIQDQMLNQARINELPITIFLVSGLKMQGKVISFDGFTVLIENNKKQQMIYKQAISTIIPSKNVKMYSPGKK
jgi:host factor-I protein